MPGLAADGPDDPRGLTTSVTDSVAGTFGARYDADGELNEQTLPGGYTMTEAKDPDGTAISRTYTRDSDGTVLLADSITETAQGQWATHAGTPGVTASQAYAHDKAGRLSQVQDTTPDAVCTTRAYTFDKHTNRKTLATSTSTATVGTDCTTSGATGTLTRNVDGLDGNLTATTTKTGGVILQLANLHGDIALQLPADSSAAPTVLDYDEYGNPRTDQPATRYGWVGGKQRSSETPTGLILMGVRLYNPGTGRFLSTDPVPGGSANAYEYCNGDPINHFDLDGRSWRFARILWRNRRVQSLANNVVAVGAIAPYAVYAGAYHVRRRHRFGRWGNSYLLTLEIAGLRADERLDDFKRRHLWRHEDTYDEHIHGSYCPRFMMGRRPGMEYISK
ncbi:RHS repeat-associated core domain-containing protein [Streptomyces misionensis]|uniref:RHS repeat-associated core domain-containing protein n=1 Tax=Streptomyces misionensis TaxID=67331 RepID=A0A1H5FKE4_9ACTN|nr:RHS repeat-associated core domain-containing protein [Streptomyces misionensis]